MAIEKMRLVLMVTNPDNVLHMISCVKDYEKFHPELATSVLKSEEEGEPYTADRIYESYLSRIERMNDVMGLNLKPTFENHYDLETIDAKLDKAEKIFESKQELENTFANMNKDDRAALEKLQQYPLSELDDGFITFGFGKIPVNYHEKLSLYHHEQFLFTELHRNKQFVWIVYVGLRKDRENFEAFFDTIHFEPMMIPEEAEKSVAFDFNGFLCDIYGFILEQAEKESYYKYVTVFNNQATMTGFVPERSLESFDALFDDTVKAYNFPPEVQKDLVAPTKLKNNWFSYPFELLVEMYGLPKYGEYDPTRYFAITYSILFGIMFGDLGQGAVIALLGYYFGKKKDSDLGRIMFRLGFFSMFFGVIFGSVFGNEEILTPLLKPFGLPIHVASPDLTMNLLFSTVGIGVVLILMSIFINICVSLKHKRYARALFTQNGLAGFLFYGFIMAMIVCQILGINIVNPLTITAFIVIPLLTILLHAPLSNFINKMQVKPKEGWAGYLVEGFFELFEVMLSFVTNTMSFLRVGGFILSHAGMMSVVMTLKDMAGSAGIIVFIVGNIIVIGLEGLIVGIQTLRLQYYEMFSRYYDGGGKPFKSVNK